MPNELQNKLTIFDAMLLIAAVGIGTWGAAAYKSFPFPPVSNPDSWMIPLLCRSIPVTAALTVGFLAVPIRTLRGRVRRAFRQEPGTAMCAAATAVLLVVVIRWAYRAYVAPHNYPPMWILGEWIFYEWANMCGLGIIVTMALLTLGGKTRCQFGWIEWMRLALAAYWLVLFLIFSVL
jgi:hypothetical protein